MNIFHVNFFQIMRYPVLTFYFEYEYNVENLKIRGSNVQGIAQCILFHLYRPGL